MSAPHTDVEKQEKDHKGPLVGMGIVAAFGVLLILFLVFIGFGQGNDPEAENTVEAVGSDVAEGAETTGEDGIVAAPEQLSNGTPGAAQQ